MKIAKEAQESLAAGFASIIEQFDLPIRFPESVNLAADHSVASQRSSNQLSWQKDRRDMTDLPFVTLDPASSTDLDQAFTLKREGKNLILYYALADVSVFVPSNGIVETEAWNRGVTIYGVADKIPLYPKVISQNAASLLPDGPRPAVLVVVVIEPNGKLNLRSVARIICKSRAKLAYDEVDLSSIPFLEDFAARMWDAETERGAIRVDFPQQEVVTDPSSPGGVRLELRVRLRSELVNSALSLAVNMAIGDLLRDAKIGLFRVMDDPDPKALAMLRRAANALHIPWDRTETLRDLQKRMDSGNAVHQKFLLDARRAGGRASYALYSDDRIPWHSAIAATYAHATAPMRRLADRYVLDLTCLIANGRSVPDELIDKLEQLPAVMERSEGKASNVDRAVIDLLEAVSLQHRIGDIIEAEIVDADNSIVQTFDCSIRHRASNLSGVENGDLVRVRIDGADPVKRTIRLTAIK